VHAHAFGQLHSRATCNSKPFRTTKTIERGALTKLAAARIRWRRRREASSTSKSGQGKADSSGARRPLQVAGIVIIAAAIGGRRSLARARPTGSRAIKADGGRPRLRLGAAGSRAESSACKGAAAAAVECA
jgi:hypothetical protein